MKRRRGFVSNSSTSAFIVIRRDNFDDITSKNLLLTTREDKLLLKYGFKKVNCYYSDQVAGELYTVRKPPTKAKLKMLKKWKIKPVTPKNNPNFNYGYDVSCNQDDVIYFLLKNNIPFEASIHYGHETILYKRGAKDFLTIQNFGVQACMSNWKRSYKDATSSLTHPAVTKTNVKKWLKQQQKWQEYYIKIMEEDDAALGLLVKKKK